MRILDSLRWTLRWTFVVGTVLLVLSSVSPADDADPQSPNPADTPLGKFFERIFQGVNDPPNQPGSPDRPADNRPAENPSSDDETLPTIDGNQRITPDAIDERAAAGRQQQRDLVRAQRLLQSGQQGAALTMLQQLLETPEDSLLLTADGGWESLQRTVERLIVTGGAPLRRDYVERFGALGSQRLQQAHKTGQPDDYADVARRYLLTPAGQESAQFLATLYRDAGEVAEADYWSRRIIGDDNQARLIFPDREADDVRATAQHRDTAAENWLQPFGGPTHHGAFPATEPVLIERWSSPIAVRPSVTEQVDWLVRDLVDDDQACIPAAIPLAVNNRIISRTLRGMSVFDASRGDLLWESGEGASVERLLQGDDLPRPGGEPTGRRVRAIPEYRGTNADGHPLANLLFRDGVYGLLSSDGEQVFVLEEHASLSFRQPGYFWGRRVEDDPFERDWGTNRLVAYDLDTGAVRWRIGGQRLNEPFDLPLVGTLFLGPPVVDGDELFIIGERDSTMFLFVLDRRTGDPLWEHAISEVGAGIEQDLVRRWWPAQPAVGRGVIVCPTTAGWMVAIDRLQRRIRWTYRYLEARQKKVSSNRSRVAATGPLNARWCPAAPVMTQRHVVFTPPELPDPLYGQQPVIVCLDLLTGERLWREEKETNLYLGGVKGETVIIVGKESLEARQLTTGKPIWKTPLDASAIPDELHTTVNGSIAMEAPGQPSGRGIIAGDDFLLSLQSGQLWSIDIATGSVRRAVALRNDVRPLGNLLIHQGRLISVGPFEVRSFEERSAIAAELAKAPNQATTAALKLRAAELKFIERDFPAALAALEKLRVDDLPPRERQQADELLWDTLLNLVQLDLTRADDEFAKLADRAETEDQQLAVERLRADRLLARGDRMAAFEVYWEHARQPQSVMVTDKVVTDEPTSLRFDRWLAGRFRRLHNAATPEERSQFDDRFEAAADSAIDGDHAQLNWWAEVLRFHPVGEKLLRSLSERAIEQKRWAAAETRLLQMIEESHNADLRDWAFERLLVLMFDRDRPDDAAAYVRTYRNRIDNAPAIEQKFADRLPESLRLTVPPWSDGEWTLSRTPAISNRAMFEPDLALDLALPSLDQLSFRLEPNLHRLSINTLNEQRLWETPLQAQSQSFYNKTTALASVGQLMFVVHRGVLHGLSLADRELLWQQKFDVRSATAGYVRDPSSVGQLELRDVQSFVWSEGLRQSRTPMGMLAVWRPGYVAYFGRHKMTVADPLTGETLWSRHGIPPKTRVHGTADTLYIAPPSPEQAYALNALDGSTIEMPKLDDLLSSAIGLNDGGMIVVEQRQPFRLFGWGTRTVRVQLVDPRTGQSVWEVDLPDETRFARFEEQEMIAVAPNGTICTIDCRTGDVQTLAELGPQVMEGVQRLFAVAERRRVYVALNQPPQPRSSSHGIPSIPVHGTLMALDRQSGLLWKQDIEGQNLIVDQLAHLPVLLLATQRSEREGDVTSQQIFIEVRDKQTGEPLLAADRYIMGGNTREMEIDHTHRQIDLKTYNERLRLRAPHTTIDEPARGERIR